MAMDGTRFATHRASTMDECIDIDLGGGDSFPYHPDTFERVRHLRRLVLRVSERVGVPPISVAGAIADEYNAMRTEWWFQTRRAFDWALDNALLRHLPEWVFEWSVRVGSSSKLLNATRHDIGTANLNLATSRAVYDDFRDRYLEGAPDWGYLVMDEIPNWEELVEYVLTAEGTVVVAALVIKKGMAEMAQYLRGREPEIRDAILVTYYKQGPSYVNRFKARLAQKPGATLAPGEGCRVYYQRFDLMSALGI